MRDLDRIQEVSEYRVTGPQLTSVAVSALVLLVAVFGIGFQLGRLQTPVDVALLEPVGATEDPESLLAEMLAEKEGRTLASTAPERPLAATDDTAPEPIEPATEAPVPDEPAVAEPVEPEEPEEPVEPEEPTESPELVASDVKPAYVREVIERSEPETPQPQAEEPPEELAVAEATPEPVAAAPALPRAPAGRGFTVQVGAYETVAEAQDIIRALQARGAEVFHVEANVNGRTWHRVRVGLYPSRAAAESAAAGLQDATPDAPFVTSQP